MTPHNRVPSRAAGSSLLLEKTLFNLEPVVEYAKECKRRGCHVHLLGTHIEPLRNWAFLSSRMAAGQSFGRSISKEQTLSGLRRYHENMQTILQTAEHRNAFDSIHVYDVTTDEWCISLERGQMGILDRTRGRA